MMNITREKTGKMVHGPDWPLERGQESEVRKLRQSLDREGQLIPMLAHRDERGFIIIDEGNRRLAAARLEPPLDELDVIVLEGNPSELELLQVKENIDIHYKKHSHHERLVRWTRMRELGLSVGEIGKRIDSSQGQVSRVLGLNRLCAAAKEMLRSESIDLEKAYIASEIEDPAKQMELLREAKELTRDQMRKRARGTEAKAHKIAFPLTSGFTVTVAGKQMTLKDAVETLVSVVKELRQAQKSHLDVITAARVMRDKAGVQA